jgi:hypothetical protein
MRERRLGRQRIRRYLRSMSYSYDAAAPEKVRIGAGTALKFGFFAAFGVLLFYLVLSIVLGVVALILELSGTVDFTALLPRGFL